MDPISRIINELHAAGFNACRASELPDATAGVISGEVQKEGFEMAAIDIRDVGLCLVGGPLDGKTVGWDNTDFHLGELQEKPVSLHGSATEVRPLYLYREGKWTFQGFEGRFPADMLSEALDIIQAEAWQVFTFEDLLLARQIVCDRDELHRKMRALRRSIARQTAKTLVEQPVSVHLGGSGLRPGVLRSVDDEACTVEWPDGFKMVNLDVERISPVDAANPWH